MGQDRIQQSGVDEGIAALIGEVTLIAENCKLSTRPAQLDTTLLDRL